MSRARLAVYPSEWAARSAIEDYGTDPARVAVIPFGANLGRGNSRAEVWRWIDERPRDCLRLLFVGRHWGRKGGEIVVQTALALAAMGHRVELDIVGCEVPLAHRDRPWIKAHGMLSTRVPEQVVRLSQLFARAHYVFVPSRAEAYGIIFAEGNAFGLPVVTTATGGITSIVRDGYNGLLQPLSAGAPEFAGAIAASFRDPGSYRQFCRQSFAEFEQRLNWRTFCRRYLERVQECCFGTEDHAGFRPRPLRVAFLANEFLDPRKPGSWSGLPYYTRRALEDAGAETHVIWSGGIPGVECWLRFLYWRLVRGKRYLRYCNERLLRGYARQIEQQLALGPPVDVVFSVSTWLLAYLKTDLPTVVYTDACFGALLGFYESFSNLAPASLVEGHQVEQLALNHCTRAIYSSHWAAQAAQKYYKFDPAKTDVVFYGANFEEPPDPRRIAEQIRQRDPTRCNLLLVGVDWVRKGVEIAVEAVESLRARGCDAHLTIVGCQPPADRVLPEGVEVIPFISKNTAEGRRRLSEIYQQQHFFILPSRAEASAIVFSEAGAFGLPCLATDVGGISSIIVSDVNGRLFHVSAEGAEYADYILAVLERPGRYQRLAERALMEANTRLSWRVSGPKLVEILRNAARGQTRCTLPLLAPVEKEAVA